MKNYDRSNTQCSLGQTTALIIPEEFFSETIRGVGKTRSVNFRWGTWYKKGQRLLEPEVEFFLMEGVILILVETQFVLKSVNFCSRSRGKFSLDFPNMSSIFALDCLCRACILPPFPLAIHFFFFYFFPTANYNSKLGSRHCIFFSFFITFLGSRSESSRFVTITCKYQ